MTAAPAQASVRLQLGDAGMALVAQEQARRTGQSLGLDARDTESAAVIAAELASNAQRHARGGQLLLQPAADAAALDVVATDTGPGVADLGRCFGDGVSSVGSLGAGLGVVRRRATRVDAWSEPGAGTVVCARVGPAGAVAGVAALGAPVRGEHVNGDAWAWAPTPGGLFVVLADGLGHGPAAAAASAAAVDGVERLAELEPRAAVELVHRRLRGTRGAAVTAVSLSAGAPGEPGRLLVAGVGNVAAAVVTADGAVRRTVISHGTAGAAIRTPLQTANDVPPGAAVVLHTDGLSGSWTLRGRPGVVRSGAPALAAVLLREAERGSDDTGVVVIGPEAGAA